MGRHFPFNTAKSRKRLFFGTAVTSTIIPGMWHSVYDKNSLLIYIVSFGFLLCRRFTICQHLIYAPRCSFVLFYQHECRKFIVLRGIGRCAFVWWLMMVLSLTSCEKINYFFAKKLTFFFLCCMQQLRKSSWDFSSTHTILSRIGKSICKFCLNYLLACENSFYHFHFYDSYINILRRALFIAKSVIMKICHVSISSFNWQTMG